MNVKEQWEKLRRGITRVSRRNWIIIGAATLIVGAVVLNLVLLSPDDGFDYAESAGMTSGEVAAGTLGTSGTDTPDSTLSVSESTDDDAYFSSTQVSRQRARDEAMEVLRGVVESETAIETVKGQALSDISRIALEIERESNIETLVSAKGFAQCVAVVNGESANIIVQSNGLLPNEIAQINEIVYEQTGIVPANVKIIEKAT